MKKNLVTLTTYNKIESWGSFSCHLQFAELPAVVFFFVQHTVVIAAHLVRLHSEKKEGSTAAIYVCVW